MEKKYELLNKKPKLFFKEYNPEINENNNFYSIGSNNFEEEFDHLENKGIRNDFSEKYYDFNYSINSYNEGYSKNQLLPDANSDSNSIDSNLLYNIFGERGSMESQSYLNDNEEIKGLYTIPSNNQLEKINELTSSTTHNKNLFIVLNKKKGRKSNDLNLKKKVGIPRKFDEDNIVSKIQVKFITFIINLINLILKKIGIKNLQFKHLSHNYKCQVSKSFRKNLISQTIENILRNEISTKYSTKDKNFNNEILTQVKNVGNKLIFDILNLNFLFFFEKIFYQKRRQSYNLSEFGLENLEFELPKKIELFEDLIEKNKNEQNFNEYKKLMDLYARKFFLPKEKYTCFKCKKSKSK